MYALRRWGPDEVNISFSSPAKRKVLREVFAIAQENDRLTAELKKLLPKFSDFYETQWILGEAELEKRLRHISFE